MIAILGILGSAWPYLLSVAFGLLALFTHLNGKAKVAAAGQQVAQAQASAAQAQTQVAEQHDADAQANATAAAAGAQALKERTNAENDIASMPAGAASNELRNDWAASSDASAGTGSGDKDKAG